jgi:glyoxylase-like metal-dependent hydrolase (beta-lactamase superfamily II)
MMNVQVRSVLSMPFAENTYVAWLSGRSDCIVIDPGLEPEAILDCLAEEKLTVAAILNTHGHADHIAGNEAMKRAFPAAPLIIGKGDEIMLSDPVANLSAVFGEPLTSPPAERTVKEGDVLELAGLTLEVREIPGHSPGHVIFLWRGEPCLVFGGDVLFSGSIGRFDFPGGDGRLLVSGIRSKLLTLAGDTIVYPGHGPVTTIAEEKATNPYVAD